MSLRFGRSRRRVYKHLRSCGRRITREYLPFRPLVISLGQREETMWTCLGNKINKNFMGSK